MKKLLSIALALVLIAAQAIQPAQAGISYAPPQSGTYTPGYTLTANVTSATPSVVMYARVGNMVIMSGQIRFVCTTVNVLSKVDFSLPIPSTFTAATDANMTGTFDYALNMTQGRTIYAVANTITNTIQFQQNCEGNGFTELHHFSGMYWVH